MTLPTPAFASLSADGLSQITRLLAGPPSYIPAVPPLTTLYVNQGTGYTSSCDPLVRVGGNFYGTVTHGDGSFNVFSVDEDIVDLSAAGGGGGTGFYFGHAVKTGAVGGRTAMGATLFIDGDVSSPITGWYAAAGFGAIANASAGGTAGAGNDRGNLFGINPGAQLNSGAGTYWSSVCGQEINIATNVGTQAVYKVGLQIIQLATDAVPGKAGLDTGLAFCSQTGTGIPGHDIGIAFGTGWGWWPMKSASATLIGTIAANPGLPGGPGPAYAAAHGVDFSGITFSSDAFKSTGFAVSPTGRATVAAQTFGTLPANFANDAAAGAGGIPLGGVYRNGSVLMVRTA